MGSMRSCLDNEIDAEGVFAGVCSAVTSGDIDVWLYIVDEGSRFLVFDRCIG